MSACLQEVYLKIDLILKGNYLHDIHLFFQQNHCYENKQRLKIQQQYASTIRRSCIH